MLMTWKKTAAGDVIYNKCPPNATGEGHGEGGPQSPGGCRGQAEAADGDTAPVLASSPLPLVSRAGSASRRCLLSPHGVAYWGVPSFARCISHEYRYLHLSVGARSGTAPVPRGPQPLLPSPAVPNRDRDPSPLPVLRGGAVNSLPWVLAPVGCHMGKQTGPRAGLGGRTASCSWKGTPDPLCPQEVALRMGRTPPDPLVPLLPRLVQLALQCPWLWAW